MGNPSHLDNKYHMGFIAIFYAMRKLVKVLYTALGWGIWEKGNAVNLQGYAFYFYKYFARPRFYIKIKAGAFIGCLGLYFCDSVNILAGLQVFIKGFVWRLAVDIYKLLAFYNCY